MVFIGLTFLTGIFAGAYLYVSVFRPAYVAPEPVGITDTRFEVAGEMVGDCGTEVCPSFILKQDRSYVYIPGYALAEQNPETVSGKLSGILLRDLEAMLRSAALTAVSGSCQPFGGSMNYRYRVVLDGAAYELNTCNASFARSPVAADLSTLWSEVTVAQNAPAAVLEEGAFGTLERYLRNQFQWNKE